MGLNLLNSISGGFQTGQEMGQAYSERQANKAMAELHAFDPAAQQGGQIATSPQTEQMAENEVSVERGFFGQLSNGAPKPPSTRDWVELRRNALAKAARLGPDAAKEAMDQIDGLQKKGALDNLYNARMLLDQGREEEALQHLQYANSYVGNFTALQSSPAKMRDGSMRGAFALVDEQTGQPIAPAMFNTPEVVDHFIQMVENHGEFDQMRHDRQLVEREWGMEQARFGWQVGTDERDFERGVHEYDTSLGQRQTEEGQRAFESERRFGLDVAKEQRARTAASAESDRDYMEALDTQLKQLQYFEEAGFDPETGMETAQRPYTQEQLQMMQTMLMEAKRDPQLSQLSPEELAQMAIQHTLGM
jgi:hypothetical protein